MLPETAARVERAIRRLGYQRNEAARRLRRKGQPTQTIGLLVDDLANPFFAALAAAVEDAARQRNYVVLIGSSNDSLRREREVVAAFCARQVDGLIVVPVAGNHRFLREQLGRGTKVVCVDRPADGLAVDKVLVDNRRRGPQGRAAPAGPGPPANRLPGRPRGHLDHPGTLRGLPRRVRRRRARSPTRGWSGTARAAGQRPRGWRITAQPAPIPPTALFTTTDLITMGAIDALHGQAEPGGADRLRRVRAGRQGEPAGHRGRPGPGRTRGDRRATAVLPHRRRHLPAPRGHPADPPGRPRLRRDRPRPPESRGGGRTGTSAGVVAETSLSQTNPIRYLQQG